MSSTMNAAVVRAIGDLPEYATFEAPGEPADGQLRVRIEAAGINPADVALSTGTYTLPSPPTPYVPGIEGIGEVEASADASFPVGARVYVGVPVVPHGTMGERAMAWAAMANPVPAELDAGMGCAIGVAGLAAHFALDHRAHLQEGEHVLVLGASGAVGQFAVQLAKLMGAGRVVAAARSAAGLELCRRVGADATVALTGQSPDALTQELQEVCDGRLDVVVDPLCGDPALGALGAMSPFGRLVQMGRSAAETMAMPSATVRGRMLSILGHTNVLVPVDVKRAAYAELAAHALGGDLQVEVERVPLADVADAWQRQVASPGHKLVLVP